MATVLDDFMRRPVSALDLQRLGRALPDFPVGVAAVEYPESVRLWVGDGKSYWAESVVGFHAGYRLVNLRLQCARGQGLGLFRAQVGACLDLGIERILTTAGGEKGSWMTGYYAWPRFGFDGRIPDAPWRKLPSDLKARCGPQRSIRALFDLGSEPRAWWKEHGGAIDLWFDVGIGSPHMAALAAYLRERGINEPVGTP